MSGSPAGEDAFDEFYHWNVRKVVHLVYAYTRRHHPRAGLHPGGVQPGLAAVVQGQPV